MKKIHFLFIFAVLQVALLSACSSSEQNFIKTENGHFIRNGKPYYYIGANYWYGAILGSTGKEGNRKRLLEELDMMKAKGIDNLRILAGAEGPDGEPRRVSPALQTAPSVYNQDLLNGLDFLLAEMAKRNMVAILYFNNAWEWSGGFSQYAAWNGAGAIPYPETDGHTWSEFMAYSSKFITCDECQKQYQNHIKFLLQRTNSITGVPYIQDPTIMTWELANEPRAFSDANKEAFLNWVNSTSAFIKSIDSNHLVTTGTEGSWGCEGDIELFEKIHATKNIDYLTIHVWPYNWGWFKINDMAGTITLAKENSAKYIDNHLKVAQKLNKPLVFEEFGLPRDGFLFSPSSAVTYRDIYYDFAFNNILESVKCKGVLAGANFWAFSGIGVPNLLRDNNMWKAGDDYLGDPPQEAQGLNSVFAKDPTLDVVKKYNNLIINALK